MESHNPAEAFRRLHIPGPLVLPNVWDASSARIIERAGAPAIATTSAGVSWALGHQDGHGLSRAQALSSLRAITAAVEVPVSVDIEGGYGRGTPEDVAETVEAVLALGVVGINLEDSPGRADAPLVEPEAQAVRIAAAREAARRAGAGLFLNARTDVFLAQAGEPEGRLTQALTRAAIYLEAGADGIFVPGVTDEKTLSALVAGIEAPVNVMAGPGSPSVKELENLGVARVSLGPALSLGALGYLEAAAKEVLRDGTYGHLETGLSFAEVAELFQRE